MKLFALIFILVLTVSCSRNTGVSPEAVKYSSFLTNSDTCPVDMGTIYATGTKIAIDCFYLEKPNTETITTEVDYTPQKNLINLSIEESEIAVGKLLLKKAENINKNNHTGSLIQGDWKAFYNPPKYPDGFDSIVVMLSGKKYTFPGVYGKEERDRYMKNIGTESGCVSFIQRPNTDKGRENVLINGTYYLPPSSLDCGKGLTFSNFHSFSPSGNYLFYNIGGYEYARTLMLDIQTGNITKLSDMMPEELVGISFILDEILWTQDRKQMVFLERSLLCITQKYNFPQIFQCHPVPSGRPLPIIIDDKYLYLLEEYSDYYLRIFDLATFEEVYSRIVRK